MSVLQALLAHFIASRLFQDSIGWAVQLWGCGKRQQLPKEVSDSLQAQVLLVFDCVPGVYMLVEATCSHKQQMCGKLLSALSRMPQDLMPMPVTKLQIVSM